jgi:hypothetical protein
MKEIVASGRVQRLIVAIAVLAGLRAIASAVLPISADEAYYWLWSRHLSAGYFDHPPAIAFLIRSGTMLFGATPIGVRFASFILSLIATWFVWRAAAQLMGREEDGAVAALYFSLTLMVAAATLAATPDAPEVACAAGFLYALMRLEGTSGARWWLAAGAAGGAALLSKYTALFLGLGTCFWLVATEEGRKWLRTPWPYAGAVLATLIVLPNLVWNAQHHWQTLAFQFARVGTGEFTLRYLGEFLGAQIGMASPFILLLAVMGLVLAANDRRLRLTAMLAAPSIAYFFIHALHDRVQANWPSFLFPVLAVAAASATRIASRQGRAAVIVRLSTRLAVPVAVLMLVACYAQALFGIIPVGRADPLSRLLGFGMHEVAMRVDQLRVQSSSAGIVTTDYATAGWLAFYLPAGVPILVLDDDGRWSMAPRLSPALAAMPLLYVAEDRHDRHAFLTPQFGSTVWAGGVERKRGRVELARYVTYHLNRLRAAPAAFAVP